jgi:hypothetical protein
VTLLGSGATEHIARVNANEYATGGRSPYDKVYQGGQAIEIAPGLEALFRDADENGWEDYQEQNGARGSRATDAHFRLLRALSHLCVVRGKLSYRNKWEFGLARAVYHLKTLHTLRITAVDLFNFKFRVQSALRSALRVRGK